MWGTQVERSSQKTSADSVIRIDRMELNVTNRYPVWKKQTEKEIRQEISARLYEIFKNYNQSRAPKGGG